MKARALVVSLLTSLAFEAAAAVRYVNVSSATPASPYTSWSTAATNIQQAIDVANSGDQILVTNGIYSSGWTTISTFLTRNRVALTKAVTVQSVNGPAVTIIRGEQTASSTGLGANSIRCAYLTNGALLAGFTLTNGATRPSGTDEEDRGGAVWCASSTAVVSNCVLINCAGYVAGGAFSGTLKFCMLTNNLGQFAGGGAMFSVLQNCSVVWSTSYWQGGGTAFCMASNCLYVDNLSLFGGAAYKCSLSQCTLVGNIAARNTLQEGGYGGGVHSCTNYNSILYFNVAYTGGDNFTGDFFTNCCTTPLPAGPGNFTNNPLFFSEPARILYLLTNSPCINAGTNIYAGGNGDLDGRPRIVGPRVDVGAYELQAGDFALFLPWLNNYYLATDGSADYTDFDGDGANNWQEWRADTNPINPSSRLRMLVGTHKDNTNTLRWASVNTRSYWLERTTNLQSASPFVKIATNITGLAGTTTYADTNATGTRPFFYRVGVNK